MVEIIVFFAILAAMYLVGLSIIILIAKALSKTHPSSPFFWRPTPGDKGEYKVIEELSWLDKTHFFVINDLLFRKSNGLTTQIDHIVVSPYGVFVIETKNITGYIYGSETSNQWLRRWKGHAPGGIYKTNELSFDNPIQQNAAHIDALSERLGRGMQIPYYSIIAFSPDATLKVNTKQQNVIYWSEIRNYIYRYSTPIMSVDEARNVFENIRALNIADPEVRSKHAESANARKRNFETKAKIATSNGKCPRCGGNLVLRQGMYGAFYGCSNYPNCRYIQKL